jgi:hypothetical protein
MPEQAYSIHAFLASDIPPHEQKDARGPRNNSTAMVANSITIINSQEKVARPSKRF